MVGDLDGEATQAGFADLVGVSQQAISNQVTKGVLQPGQTLRQWLLAYCEHLRTQAAGRGGDDQASLTRARMREAEANAQLKELQFYQGVKELVPASEVEPLLNSWAVTARSETTYAVEKLVQAIQSKHKIEVDQGLVNETLDAAYTAIADYPKIYFEGDSAPGGGELAPT